MLLEVYILFQILAVIGIILTIISYTDKLMTIYPSILTLLLSGILSVGAWVLNVGTNYVWNTSMNAYIAEANIISTPYLASFNIAIFGLALVYFFVELFEILRNEAPEVKNVVSGKGEGLNTK